MELPISFYIAERIRERVRRIPLLRPVIGFWWRRAMIRQGRFPREWFDGSIDGFIPEDFVDVAVAFARKNPDRIGCPSLQVLHEFATHERGIDDPSVEHVVNCSPCYRQMRSFQHTKWPWLRRARSRSVGSLSSHAVLTLKGFR